MSLPSSPEKKAQRQQKREVKARIKEVKAEEKAVKKKATRKKEVKQMVKAIGKYRIDELDDALKRRLTGTGNAASEGVLSKKGTGKGNRISGKAASDLYNRAADYINGNERAGSERGLVRFSRSQKGKTVLFKESMTSNYAKTFMTKSGLRNLKGAIDRVAGKLGVKNYTANSAAYRAVLGATARRTAAAMASGAIKNKSGEGIRMYALRTAMSIVEKKGMAGMSPEERKAYTSARTARAKERKKRRS